MLVYEIMFSSIQHRKVFESTSQTREEFSSLQKILHMLDEELVGLFGWCFSGREMKIEVLIINAELTISVVTLSSTFFAFKYQLIFSYCL